MYWAAHEREHRDRDHGGDDSAGFPTWEEAAARDEEKSGSVWRSRLIHVLGTSSGRDLEKQ